MIVLLLVILLRFHLSPITILKHQRNSRCIRSFKEIHVYIHTKNKKGIKKGK